MLPGCWGLALSHLPAMPGFLCQNLRVYTASELCDACPFPKAPRREALPSPRHGQLLVLVLGGWGRAEPLEARPCSCMEALARWLCVTFSSAKCVQRAKERCEGRCCPPPLPSCSPYNGHLGLPGVPPAKAASSTTWKHVPTLKHMSNSSCNHMLKVKPHA